MKPTRRDEWANARAIANDRHEMAAILGTNAKSVSRLMAYYGLPRFTPIKKHSDETVGNVVALYKSGTSLAAIAQAKGLTRNAVAGILSRAGVMGERIKTIKKIAAIKKIATKRKALLDGRLVYPPKFKREKFKAKPDPVIPFHVSLDERAADACAFPYGDGPFTFCGHPKQRGFNYCPDHAALMYAPTKNRNRTPFHR